MFGRRAEVDRESQEREAGPVFYVHGLQRDARLLLRHVARRTDRGLDLSPSDPALPWGSMARIPPALTAAPERVAESPADLGALVAFVDDLGRRAAPATVSTLRLTYAYLRTAIEGGEPPTGPIREARTLRGYTFAAVLIAILVFVATVAALMYVDTGRRALLQVQAIGGELRQVDAEIGRLLVEQAAAEAGGERRYVRFCPEQNAAADAGTSRAPRTPQEDALCGRRSDLRRKLSLAYVGVALFNCYGRNYDLLGTPGERCGYGAPMLSGEVPLPAWEATEIRATQTIGLLTGFVLPMFLGCLGGCAYALRRIDEKLKTWTLETRDGPHGLVRILLASILGGLLGVVWSPEEGVTIGTATLSLAATAFFVGFSLEVVFSVIETMVESVAGKLRATPVFVPPASAPFFASPSPAPTPAMPSPGTRGDADGTAAPSDRKDAGESPNDPPGPTAATGRTETAPAPPPGPRAPASTETS